MFTPVAMMRGVHIQRLPSANQELASIVGSSSGIGVVGICLTGEPSDQEDGFDVRVPVEAHTLATVETAATSRLRAAIEVPSRTDPPQNGEPPLLSALAPRCGSRFRKKLRGG